MQWMTNRYFWKLFHYVYKLLIKNCNQQHNSTSKYARDYFLLLFWLLFYFSLPFSSFFFIRAISLLNSNLFTISPFLSIILWSNIYSVFWALTYQYFYFLNLYLKENVENDLPRSDTFPSSSYLCAAQTLLFFFVVCPPLLHLFACSSQNLVSCSFDFMLFLTLSQTLTECPQIHIYIFLIHFC